MTTPSKPYIPKDDPSTPAVVISDALVGSSQAATEKARTAQTIPGQTRSAPVAAPAPLPIAQASSPVSSLDDTYPPARRKGSKLPLLLGAAAVAAIATIALVKLGGGDAKPAPSSPTSSAVSKPTEPVSQPPTPVTTPAAPTAEAPGATAQVAPAVSEEAATRTLEPEPVAAPKRGRPAKKAAPAPVPRKTAARSEPKAVSVPAPAPEPAAPAPAPTPKPAKGVIVRETPF